MQLLKLAKSRLEDARISVRAVRDEEMKELERAFKATEFGEDENLLAKNKFKSK